MDKPTQKNRAQHNYRNQIERDTNMDIDSQIVDPPWGFIIYISIYAFLYIYICIYIYMYIYMVTPQDLPQHILFFNLNSFYATLVVM